jgi:putative ABC transport system permease protein
VTRYFLRSFLRQFTAGAGLFLLSLFGVALGVAAVVSIQIINLNALGAFSGSIRAVSGDADASVVGRVPVLPEAIYPEILAFEGVAAAWPLVRIDVAHQAEERTIFLEVLGVDLFTPVEIPWDGPRVDFSEALGLPGWVAVTPTLAREQGWKLGDTFTISIGTRSVELQVGALSDFQRATPLASPRLVVMDIAQAQSLLGNRGELHQIDVKLRDDVDAEPVLGALRRALGDRAQVLTPEQREQQAADLSSAFRLNLTALSLISLFVGGFLVYSSTQASLVRRRTEFGLLRSLGATQGQVFSLLLADVFVLGALGVLIGTPLGYLAADANVDRVSATVSNLYLLEEIHTLTVPPSLFALAAGVGLLGSLMGAFFPSLELGRKDTRSLLAAFELHERVGAAAPWLFLVGLANLAAVGVIYLLVSDTWRPAGFLQAFLLIVSIPLLTPLTVQTLTERVHVRSFGLRYGMKGLGRQLQTTPVAIAALAVAVAMMVGITTMVESFRRTLDVWVSSTIRADIYVSTPSGRRARQQAVLEQHVIDELRAHPAVVQLDRLRQFFAHTSETGRRFTLSGIDTRVSAADARFALLEGEPEAALSGLADGGVFVGEPLARKEGLHVGNELVVDGHEGPVTLPIVAVYYDYSSELGSAFVSLDTMEREFGAGPVQNVALYLRENADPEDVVDALRGRLQGTPIEIRSNRTLRDQVFRVFSETFAITGLLRFMSLLIAVTGVTLALLALARERSSELALYRALGAERSQVFRVYLGKGLGMGITGIAMGTVAGILFALLLIYVVNRAFFGWTIAVHWPFGILASQSLVILGVAVLASFYPAVLASRTPATELRREDL